MKNPPRVSFAYFDVCANFFSPVLFEEALWDTLSKPSSPATSFRLRRAEYEPEGSQKPITSIDLSCTFLAAVPKRTADKIDGAPPEDTMPDDGYAEHFAPV